MKNVQKKTYTFRGPLELEVIMMQDMKTQGYTDKSSYIRDCIMKSANSSGGSRKQKQRMVRYLVQIESSINRCGLKDAELRELLESLKWEVRKYGDC